MVVCQKQPEMQSSVKQLHQRRTRGISTSIQTGIIHPYVELVGGNIIRKTYTKLVATSTKLQYKHTHPFKINAFHANCYRWKLIWLTNYSKWLAVLYSNLISLSTFQRKLIFLFVFWLYIFLPRFVFPKCRFWIPTYRYDIWYMISTIFKMLNMVFVLRWPLVLKNLSCMINVWRNPILFKTMRSYSLYELELIFDKHE